MEILLNGDRHAIASRQSVQELLSDLGLDTSRVAVEVNRRILKRSEFDSAEVGDGDEIEVVTFVGGG
jgi:sulfur carrier protein